MAVAQAEPVAFGLLLLAMAIIFFYFSKWLGSATGLLLVAAGFGAAELYTGWGLDTGIRWHNLQFIMLELLLPIIIYRAAIELDISALRLHLLVMTVLALPVMLVMLLLTAAMLFAGIGHPAGFPWIAAFLAASMLIAIQPGFLVTRLNQLGRTRLASLLETESLLSDTTAIFLFGLLVGAAASGLSAESVMGEFTRALPGVVAGGVAVGLAASLLQRGLNSVLPDSIMIPVSLLLIYGSFQVAESLFNASGVLAVALFGLMGYRAQSEWLLTRVRYFWQTVAGIAGYSVYLLAGVTFTFAMFEDRWLAMLIGVMAVMFARILAVVILVYPLQRAAGNADYGGHDSWLLAVGGSRGAVTLALALSLPLALDYWYTVQAIAYGVVLFTMSLEVLLVFYINRRGSSA